MNHKYNFLSYSEAATRIISEQYESNRLKDLVRVQTIQTGLTMYDPGVSNIVLMCMVNALFPTVEETDVKN